jgi:hypothetical protein
MISFVIHLLAVVGLLAIIAVVLAFVMTNDADVERARIDMEVRRAERQIHDIARQTFAAMLDEARAHDRSRRA